MTAFTVWKFDDAEGAGRAAKLLKQAEEEQMVKLVDHAVVSWPVGAKRPNVHQAHDEATRGAVWGGFWGLLFGALFAIPLLGAAAGAAMAGIGHMTEGAGIGKKQLEQMRSEITEGTSALFLVTEEGNLDRLGERFRGVHSRLVETNLTPAEREVLLEAVGQN